MFETIEQYARKALDNRGMTMNDLKQIAATWHEQVWERFQGQCGNCGGSHKLRVRMIVPEEAGGQKVSSNGVVLCRACEMASEAASRAPGSAGEKKWPVNFLVSRRLYERMETLKEGDFKSFGALVRYVMSTYVRDPGRFDDLESYQDNGTDTKINVWVPADLYETFKRLVTNQNLTVTAAVKGLVMTFDEATKGQ